MRKDGRVFIRRLEAAGLTVEPTAGHYRVLREGKPLRKANGMPFTLPAIVELRKLGVELSLCGREIPKDAGLGCCCVVGRGPQAQAGRAGQLSCARAFVIKACPTGAPPGCKNWPICSPVRIQAGPCA
jgi:hypothetical protein